MFCFLGPGGQIGGRPVDNEPQQHRHDGENGHGGEHGVSLHAGIGLDHHEPKPCRSAHPFADDGAERGKRRRDPQARNQRWQRQRHAQPGEDLPVARLSQRGGVEDGTIGAVEPVSESGGNGEEDDDRRHDHFRSHAETEPEDEDGGEHEDRKGLQHQNHGPDEAAEARDGGNGESDENAGGDARRKPERHFTERYQRLPEQEARLTPESAGNIGWRWQDVAGR